MKLFMPTLSDICDELGAAEAVVFVFSTGFFIARDLIVPMSVLLATTCAFMVFILKFEVYQNKRAKRRIEIQRRLKELMEQPQ